MSVDIKKLSREEYLEWKLSINEVNDCDRKMRILQLERKLLEFDIREKMRKENEQGEVKRDKHEQFLLLRKKLEERVGLSFDKAIIDEVTLEVKELETTKEG